MISTLCDGHKLAVAMVDPGDSHTAGMIRLLTGSKTAAGRGSVVIAQKPTRQSRVNPCYLFSRCFHLVDSSCQNIIKRFSVFVQERKEEKEDKIQAWKHIGDSNFYKSLDHLSFLFKKVTSTFFTTKHMLSEIKTIHRKPVHAKSPNELKGGSSPKHEFFCTYNSFNIKNV